MLSNGHASMLLYSLLHLTWYYPPIDQIKKFRQMGSITPGHEIIGHTTYTLVSDEDLQEGVASEAASLAGTLGLDKFICIYGDTEISIEGDTHLSFREDVAARFRAYGWEGIGPVEYRDSVLAPGVRARVSVEASASIGRERYAGLDGAVIGMTGYGASASGAEVLVRFGFTAENVQSTALSVLERLR